MGPTPIVLLVPSRAATREWPRRLAASGRALTAFYPFRVKDLARVLAEPALLGRGLRAWHPGHGALIAAQLLERPHGLRLDPSLPLAPVARSLARTLGELRLAGVAPERLAAGVAHAAVSPEDAARLASVAALYQAFHAIVEGRFADPAALYRAARDHLSSARWLSGAEILVVDDPELRGLPAEFVARLAERHRVSRLTAEHPEALAVEGSLNPLSALPQVEIRDTVLAPLAPAPLPEGLRRLRTRLFDAPQGTPAFDASVDLVTGAGEAAEARAVVRRLLRAAARGVPFEDMAIVLPRPQDYAPLFADLLAQAGIPHRLHPSLPLRHGRAARALLLLFRCRCLARAEVMEFLTFAPVPFRDLLGDDAMARPAQWDRLSREAGIVKGLERWMLNLRAEAESRRETAGTPAEAARAEWHLRRAADAEALLRVVEILNGTLEVLSGDATWPEWSARVRDALDQWVGEEPDRDAVVQVLAELGSLGTLSARASWGEVESVLEARLEWERIPVPTVTGGAVHVGALDAISGVPFRFVAVVGLVEGGFPGVLRPDPFLLDSEREALAKAPAPVVAGAPAKARQLSLFGEASPADAAGAAPSTAAGAASTAGLPLAAAIAPMVLPTTQERLRDARRAFHAALRQATETLVLSYPRADPRSGRERLPSLFFVAAASTLAGRPLGTGELAARVAEDALEDLPLSEAVDAAERDRARVRRGGDAAIRAIEADAPFFRSARLAARSRWHQRLGPYDGHLRTLSPEARQALDPTRSGRPVSASALSAFAQCGFRYLLGNLLKLEEVPEPEERRGLDARERGQLFHEVAEHFLRERRDRGEWPLKSTPELVARLHALAEERVQILTEGRPPRYRLLWDAEWRTFLDLLESWLKREVASGSKTRPVSFEAGFGLPGRVAAGERSLTDPLQVELGDGRRLSVRGKIDRVDEKLDGTLVVRDYKTGRAPKDAAVFRGGQQLQIPFYVLAAELLFPGKAVSEAFLDFVDGGRPVVFDPATVTGDTFRKLLRDMVDLMADGLFPQNGSACKWCDFKIVCGPAPLLLRRYEYKVRDESLQRVLRLRDVR